MLAVWIVFFLGFLIVDNGGEFFDRHKDGTAKGALVCEFR